MLTMADRCRSGSLLNVPATRKADHSVTTLEALSRLRDLGELGLLHQNAQHPDRARLAELATRVAIHMDAPTCMVNAVLPGAVALLAGHGVAGYVEAVGGIPDEWA